MIAADKWYHQADVKFGAATAPKAHQAQLEAGQAYHRKVYKQLRLAFGGNKAYRLLIEPWFVSDKGRRCSPDSVLFDVELNIALVVEIKLNWASGRDEKLINLYLPVVKAALGVEEVWPLLITKNVRGYNHPVLCGMDELWDAMAWLPGQPTPLLLHP